MSEIFYLAPMQGFTDVVFRNVYGRHFDGLDLAVSPFISAMPGGKVKANEIGDVVPENNSGIPVIPQIMGNDADDFIIVANRLHDLGYETVNWNLGCPYRMVAKKKRGSGLLCHPDLVESLLEKVVPAIKGRLSLKIRLGRYSEDEIYELLPVFNRFPLDEIIVHPRTGVQMYDGTVNLELFQAVLEMSENRVVYNGDINSVETFETLSKRFGQVNRWMLGRGVLMNPFLPSLIRGDAPNPVDFKDILRRFHDDYYETRLATLSGPAHIVDKMKSFWTYFSFSFKNKERVFKKIKKVKKPEHYEDVVNGFFECDAQVVFEPDPALTD